MNNLQISVKTDQTINFVPAFITLAVLYRASHLSLFFRSLSLFLYVLFHAQHKEMITVCVCVCVCVFQTLNQQSFMKLGMKITLGTHPNAVILICCNQE
jgi:exosortase/archaeosortase